MRGSLSPSAALSNCTITRTARFVRHSRKTRLGIGCGKGKGKGKGMGGLLLGKGRSLLRSARGKSKEALLQQLVRTQMFEQVQICWSRSSSALLGARSRAQLFEQGRSLRQVPPPRPVGLALAFPLALPLAFPLAVPLGVADAQPVPHPACPRAPL